MVLRKEVTMAINIRYLSNINGIPRLESNSVSVNTANVVFTFTNPGTRFNNEFNGLVLLKFNQVIPTGTTGTLPILINNQAITTYNGAALTVTAFKGTGIYLAYYDSGSKTLQIID